MSAEMLGKRGKGGRYLRLPYKARVLTRLRFSFLQRVISYGNQWRRYEV